MKWMNYEPYFIFFSLKPALLLEEWKVTDVTLILRNVETQGNSDQ